MRPPFPPYAYASLRDIKAGIEKLGQINRKHKEEGATIIELLGGFKKTYLAADLERKAGILNALVDKAVLRGGDLHVFCKPAFDVLFTLGQGVIKKGEWCAG